MKDMKVEGWFTIIKDNDNIVTCSLGNPNDSESEPIFSLHESYIDDLILDVKNYTKGIESNSSIFQFEISNNDHNCVNCWLGSPHHPDSAWIFQLHNTYLKNLFIDLKNWSNRNYINDY